MSDRLTLANRLQRSVNIGAGLSVIVLGVAVSWAIVTGSVQPGSSVASAANAAARPAPPAALFAPPADPIEVAEAFSVGQVDAPVTLIEFSDFRCPFCARFARETLPALEKEFVASGKLRVAYKHLPIPGLHPDAPLAAEAAECAGRQGRFRAMHDALFAAPGRLNGDGLVAAAVSLGLDEAPFRTCLTDGQMRDRVARDTAEARALGATGTPAFFIGITEDDKVRVTEVVSGAQPIDTFRDAIQRALDAAEDRQ